MHLIGFIIRICSSVYLFAVFTDIVCVVHTCRDSNTYVPGLIKYVLTCLDVKTYVPELKYLCTGTQTTKCVRFRTPILMCQDSDTLDCTEATKSDIA
jgi:hypothetical protein